LRNIPIAMTRNGIMIEIENAAMNNFLLL